MSGRRIIAIIKKEFIHIKRDRPSLVMAFMMPIFMLLLFGYAVTTDVNNMSLAVLDQDRQQPGRELVAVLEQTGYFTVSHHIDSLAELEWLLDAGEVKAGLVIPGDYARSLRRGEPAAVQFLVDGSDPLVARTAMSTAEFTARAYSQRIQLDHLHRQGVETVSGGPSLDLRARVWYNPGMESLKFNIPGLIGLIMQNITVMLTAFSLVRERERGTLEQLMVTPIQGFELMIGKLAPYVLIAFIDVAIVLSIGILWFGVPVSGSIPLLLSLTLLFLVFALGLGIFFSTVAKTQLQAMQMTMLVILPSVLLSGFLFPRESMPLVIQWLGNLIPLTYFLEILRGIILKGVGIDHLWSQVLTLSGFGLGIIVLASKRFVKRVE
ncbi:MAG: ABC transporter permease [Clostridia bacterium]|nr:ABC transporter permease [Clostridia bacterium]MDQ7792428.1 ABC transporter permease [Clostridia bacterium]